MKSFKIRENLIHIDGVLYGPTPSEYKVQGKAGRIQSISIPNRGQFFPISGEFNDGSAPIVDETPVKKTKLAKTELKESSSIPVDVDGNPIKVRKSKSK